MASKTYISSVFNRTARPRSERLRKLGVLAGSVSSSSSSSSGGTIIEGHTHSNLEDLEKLSVSGQTLLINEQGARVANAGHADSTAALDDELQEALENEFLRKDQDDTTTHTLTVGGLKSTGNVEAEGDVEGKNVTATETVSGKNVTASEAVSTKNLEATGTSALNEVTSKNITNEDTITTKNLKVTGKATFFELLIQKIKSVGGSAMFTPADGFTIDAFETDTANAKMYLYWRATDGEGNGIDNMWKVNDQALHMDFNRATVGTSWNVSNKYYWAVVTDRNEDHTPVSNFVKGGTQIDTDGNTYNYIAISINTSAGLCDGTPEPEIGDDVVMCGYRGTDDDERQSAVYIACYDSLDTELTAPFVAQYRGINDFSLKDHRYSYFDAVGAKFIGEFEVKTSSGNKSLDDYIAGKMNLDARIIINGDDADAPSSVDPTSAFMQEIMEKAGVDDIADLVGAVYITTEKMFYMLTYDEDADEYSWEDDTDGTLKALYENYTSLSAIVSQISDDAVVTPNEKRTLAIKWADVKSQYSTLVANYNNLADKYKSTDGTKAISTLTTAYNALKTMSDAVTADLTTYSYLSDYEGEDVEKESFSRTELTAAYTAYATAFAQATELCKVSGFVSKDGYATMFASAVDSQGIAHTADITTTTENVYETDTVNRTTYPNYPWTADSSGNYYYMQSLAMITADNVFIESGDKAFGDYFSLNGGNIWCQNITVEGVINNLINVIDIAGGKNADKLIAEGSETEKSLDVLRLGDVIRIDSTHASGASAPVIWLPYYLKEGYDHRGYTRYGDGSTAKQITPTQLKQLIGRKLTIYFNVSESEQYLKGCVWMNLHNLDSETMWGEAINEFANGTPVFDYPDDDDWGVQIGPNKIVHLEFRLVRIYDNGNIYPAYMWCMTQAEESTSTNIDNDSAWQDEEDE